MLFFATETFRILIAVALCVLSACRTQKSVLKDEPSSQQMNVPELAAKYKVALNFSGKATAVVWDLGVASELERNIREFRDESAIFTGNSSGSFMAAFFSCNGLNGESADRAISAFKLLERSQIPEKPLWHPPGAPLQTKAKRFTVGLRIETEVTYLKDFIRDKLRDKAGLECVPKHPLIIVSANGHVLDDRRKGKLVGGAPRINVDETSSTKIVDNESLRVFKKNQDGSRGDYLGQACTYFLTSELFRAYKTLPPESLKCDLREVRTSQDLMYAVITSVSEPTFYYPVADIDTGSADIYNSGCWHSEFTDPYWAKTAFDRNKPFSENTPCPKVLGNESYRYYFGGFPMTTPYHDLKRVLPDLYGFSTGRTELGKTVNDVLAAYFNIQSDTAYLYNRYWVDFETQPTAQQVEDMNNYDIGPDTIIAQAIEKTKKCLADDMTGTPTCRPAQVKGRHENLISVLPPSEAAGFVGLSGAKLKESRSLRETTIKHLNTP